MIVDAATLRTAAARVPPTLLVILTMADSWGSTCRDGKDQVGDAISEVADGGVAEQDVLGREFPEEGAVALAHDDGHQIDGHFIE